MKPDQEIETLKKRVEEQNDVLAAKFMAAESRAFTAEREMSAILDTLPADVVVRVREGAGPESVAASLAVSVAKLRTRMETAEERISSYKEDIRGLLRKLDAARERSETAECAKNAVVAGMLAMLKTHGRLSTETAEDFVGRLKRERDVARARLKQRSLWCHAKASGSDTPFATCRDLDCVMDRAALGENP